MRNHVASHLIQPSSVCGTVIEPFSCGFCGRSGCCTINLIVVSVRKARSISDWSLIACTTSHLTPPKKSSAYAQSTN